LLACVSLAGAIVASPAAAAPRVVPTIVQRYPHDTAAFTEGLVLYQGQLFESTGLEGSSSLRRVDRATGKVLQSVTLDPKQFGEGLAAAGDRLIQLTWKNDIAHVYDLQSFSEINRFDYSGEGWGLCFDGTRLVMSDGSSSLFFRDPATFALLGSLSVSDDGSPVPNLNELECVGSDVFANVWLTNDIVRIDAASGRVLTRIDASALRAAETAPGADVLNGIAYDPANGHFLLAGKLWSTLYEVTLPDSVVPGAKASSAGNAGAAGAAPAAPQHFRCELTLPRAPGSAASGSAASDVANWSWLSIAGLCALRRRERPAR
jgi:glutamine cyclotransferase